MTNTYAPIVAPANRPTIEAPATADVGIMCGGCLDTLAPDGTCGNVGACTSADASATRYARRSTLKAPMAVTRTGAID
jgi:hypothetical protein